MTTLLRGRTRPTPAALRDLFAGNPEFGRLLRTRLLSQGADGVFQSALVGAVVFDPTRRTGPGQIAAGFVVLLAPYSLVGPFAGVLLDRWRRQRVLQHGAAGRSGAVVVAAALLAVQGSGGRGFTLAALAALSVNRFYLAALSASLPGVVRPDRLVLANAVSPTAGTLVTIAGGLLGVGVRSALGGGPHADAVVTLLASVGYAAAALSARRLPVTALGPPVPDRSPLRRQLAGVGRGLLWGRGTWRSAGRPRRHCW